VTSRDEILYNDADDFLILEWFVLVTRVALDGTLQTVQAGQEGRIPGTFLQESGMGLSEPFEKTLIWKVVGASVKRCSAISFSRTSSENLSSQLAVVFSLANMQHAASFDHCSIVKQ
jgi:hypothetical protein